jgi:flagellar hook-associated protein 2
MSSMSSSISNLITPASFTGQSKFSQDFQQVLDRAVQLQSLNLQNLQISQQQIQSQQSAIQSVDAIFSNLQKSIDTLSSSTGLASLAAHVSDTSVASVALSSGASNGTYTLEVTGLGSHTQAISGSASPAVTDVSSQNISSSSSFTLAVNGVNHTITPAQNTLQGLVNAINGDSSTGVSASIVNVGGSASPDYRLSIQSNALDAVTVQLNDGTNDLLNTISTGSQATYRVDGLPDVISSTSNTITLSPGVTANLLSLNPGRPVTISVDKSTNAISSALQSFATAYNAAVDQIRQSHGQNANSLQGDTVLFSTQEAFQSINSFMGNNGQPLTFVGLDLDTTGHLTFNSSELQSSINVNGFASVTQFLGDSSSGLIHAATSAVQSLEDPVTGTIKAEEKQLANSLTKMNTQINDEVDRINTFQQNLLTQLAQSDAAITQLENQATYFENLFNTNNKNNN